MSPEELAAIRERAEAAVNALPDGDGPELGALDRLVIQDVPALLAEVERLRGERDEIAAAAGKAAYERDQLQARLDKVRALHSPVAPSPSRPWVTCSGCTNGGPYPCPTIQCLDGSDQ